MYSNSQNEDQILDLGFCPWCKLRYDGKSPNHLTYPAVQHYQLLQIIFLCFNKHSGLNPDN